MANQAGVSKKTIYDIHFGRQKRTAQQAAPPQISQRFVARKLDGTDNFWCVWDTASDALAFGGALTYLTEGVAITRARELCTSHGA
jgi:hypothetical protein